MNQIKPMNKTLVMCVSLAVVGANGLTGCATPSGLGAQTTVVEFYPTCYSPIDQLREADKRFNETVVAGVMIGAATGALTGYLSGGGGQGAAIGAASGAVAGGSIAYMKAKQDNITDSNARLASYQKDARDFNSSLNATVAAAKTSQQCYKRELTSLQERINSGQIVPAEAEKRRTEIVSGLTEISGILGKTVETANKRQGEMETALKTDPALANERKVYEKEVLALQKNTTETKQAASPTSKKSGKKAKATTTPKKDNKDTTAQKATKEPIGKVDSTSEFVGVTKTTETAKDAHNDALDMLASANSMDPNKKDLGNEPKKS